MTDGRELVLYATEHEGGGIGLVPTSSRTVAVTRWTPLCGSDSP
jgi:hypothetical protein